MKVKKNDIIDLWSSIEKLLTKENTPVKFRYFLIRNKKIISSEINMLTELVTPSNKYVEYEDKRMALAKEFSDKDENGNPKIDGNNFVIDLNKEVFAKEINNLKTIYKDAVEAFQKQLEKYNSELDIVVEFPGYKIKIDNIPDEVETSIIELFENLDLIME